MSFIAGAFEGHIQLVGGGSYSAIGCTEDGWTLGETHHKEDVRTDCYGQAPVDGIQRGTSARLRLNYVEYDLVAAALYAAQGGAGSAGRPAAVVGRLASALAFELALVPVAGTPAETQIGAGNCYYFSRCLVEGNFETLLSSRLRKGPLSIIVYPSDAGLNYEITTDPT